MNFFHDQQRNLLIYERPSPLLAQHIPEARQVNGSCVAFPFTLRNAQVCQWLRHPTPPIITDRSYDFPHMPGITPYESQKLKANFLALNPRCFDLSDMGTGKTMAALWAADWVMQQFPKGECRALIVAPLSILQRVWSDAIFKNFLNRRTFEVLYGSAEKRSDILRKEADFYIINFDGVGIGAHTRKRFEIDGFSKQLAGRDDIRITIVDEASAYKDAQTKRHRIARLVFGSKPYLWMLTGTPTPNAPTDAYGLAKMVNQAYGKSFRTFQAETMHKVSQFKWVPTKDGYEKARKLLTPSIRIDIKEVWDGPALTTQQREVELTAEQKKMMADLKRDLQVTVKSGKPITAANEAAVRTKFMQITQGAIYDEHHNVHLIDAEPRLNEIEAVIESTNRSVVLFVGLTSVLNLLYKRLSKRWKCLTLNGDVSPSQRATNIQAFGDDPAFKVMLADPQTTAHGINSFVVADTAIWAGPTDKNELYIQGNKRIDRPGQKYPMTIVQIVSTPLEREIYKRLETNTSLQGLLLDMVRKGEL